MARLREAVADVRDIKLHLQPVQDIQIESRLTPTQYQYVLQDLDEAELRLWANNFFSELQKQPDLADVATDQQDLGQQMMITVDREAAARFGLNIWTIVQHLYDAFGQRQIATIYGPIYQYKVILEVVRNTATRRMRSKACISGTRRSLESQVRSASSPPQSQSAPVPLAAFAKLEKRLAPLLVTHQNEFPAVALSFNLAPGVSLGQALETLRRTQAADRHAAAQSTPISSAAPRNSSLRLKAQPFLIAAAIIAVYIVLGILYESYIHPITILSTLPSAGIGALLAMMLFHQDLNLVSLIGIILLIGIVKKNGIMMVDFALAAERQEGLSPEQSIYQACLLRFRPIMMTTMAALLGALPLAIGTGTGSELRRPLGIAVVGGLLVSQFLTLYATPVVYIAFARIERRFRRKSPPATPAPSSTAARTRSK